MEKSLHPLTQKYFVNNYQGDVENKTNPNQSPCPDFSGSPEDAQEFLNRLGNSEEKDPFSALLVDKTLPNWVTEVSQQYDEPDGEPREESASRCDIVGEECPVEEIPREAGETEGTKGCPGETPPKELPDGRKLNEYGEYEFDDEFEECLIALTIRNRDFSAKYGHLIKDEYFSSQMARDLFIIAMEYQDKYGKEIDKPILKNEVREHYARYRHRDESLDDYLASVDRMFDVNPERMPGYASDKVVTFAKRRQLKINVKLIAQNVMGDKSDLESLRGKVEEALNIGKSLNGDLDLPTFTQIGDIDLEVEWVVEGVIPAKANTLFHSTGGSGKTYFLEERGKCVANGERFFGMETKKMVVYYIDFENPITELSERAQKIGKSEMKLWHLSVEPPPPRLDSDDWKIYKTLPPGLIIFHSLRSAQRLDENSSKDMTIIVDRLKELRTLGFTIISVHHAPKADKRTFRGSMAIFDMVDHVLKCNRVKKIGSDDEAMDDENIFDLPIRFGLGDKSRFASGVDFKPMFFQFIDQRLTLVSDPDDETLIRMQNLLSGYEEEHGVLPNQTQFREIVKTQMGIGRKPLDKLLRKGKGKFWRETPRGTSILYAPTGHNRSGNPSEGRDINQGIETTE